MRGTQRPTWRQAGRVTGLLVWLGCLLAQPATAADWQIDAGNQALQPVTDSGQRLATPNLSGFQLAAEAEVQPNLLLGVRWWLPYGDNSPERGPQGTFDGQGLTATAKWRFPVTEHLRPYGRFGAGALWGKATVGDNLRSLHANTATAMLDAAGGIELLLPRDWPRLAMRASRFCSRGGMNVCCGWLAPPTRPLLLQANPAVAAAEASMARSGQGVHEGCNPAACAAAGMVATAAATVAA